MGSLVFAIFNIFKINKIEKRVDTLYKEIEFLKNLKGVNHLGNAPSSLSLSKPKED